MPFTQDWFTHNIEVWEKFLEPYRYQEAHFLEIGCFEGAATMWLLSNILLHPASTITVVDTFEGSPEFATMGVDFENLAERFKENCASEAERIQVWPFRSIDALRLIRNKDSQYDFIYVDGSHAAADVLTDAVLSWPLLKENGILMFDDYLWRESNVETQNPQLGILSFMRCFEGRYEHLYTGWQVLIRKLPIVKGAD